MGCVPLMAFGGKEVAGAVETDGVAPSLFDSEGEEDEEEEEEDAEAAERLRDEECELDWRSK